MSLYKMVLFLHLALGVAALVSYWVAALAKKGSPPHKLAGNIYVLVMAALLLPAIPLTLRLMITRSHAFGWFLFYLLLITCTALWLGWFAVRNKRDFARYIGRAFRPLAWVNIAAGIAILGLGIASRQPIFIGFSVVGVLIGRGMLSLARKGPGHPRWWMEQHMGAMLGCGVATHIAFLSIGLPRLLPSMAGPLVQNVAWLGPLAVAGAARVWLGHKYLPKSVAPPPQAGADPR